MNRVKGKIALITGGAGGIGAATAKRLKDEGATVTITDVSANGPKVAKELGCDFIRHDVTSEAEWQRVIAEVAGKHGGIDFLLNGAGVEGELKNSTPEHTTYEEWRRVFAINCDGTFLGCKTVLPVMKRKGEGSIVNISSMVSFFPTPTTCSYGATKAAVQQFSKSVAAYGAREGLKIRCNSVHPGIIRTRMLLHIAQEMAQAPEAKSNEAADALAREIVPLGRLGEPEEVADLVLYLASDESRYVTGCEFRIDGGWGINMMR
jgi:NAD(P)-dependent dehydrogenase (short-subunit alcohol dehydrogenase family)